MESLTEYSEWTRRWTKRGSDIATILAGNRPPHGAGLPAPPRCPGVPRGIDAPRTVPPECGTAARVLCTVLEHRRGLHPTPGARRQLRSHVLAQLLLRDRDAGDPRLAAPARPADERHGARRNAARRRAGGTARGD